MHSLSATVQRLRKILTVDSGQDSVEYAIMIGIIALAAITSVSTLSGYVTSVFGSYATTL